MSRQRRARLSDVAAAAQVSISTVSHVVNGTRFVARDTRTRVEQALLEFNYVNPTSSRPDAGHRAVGLAITAASNPYVGELIDGIESEVSRNGQALLLCDTHDDPAREAQAISTLLAHNVDAVILAPSAGWTDGAESLLRRHETPFVLVDRMSDVRCDQIATENEGSTATLIEHLIDLGHDRIGMISGLVGLSSTEERITGFRRAHNASGREVDPKLIADGRSTTNGGRAAALKLMRNSRPPTALFSANNAMTIGVLLALRELGCQIPKDVALVVFDDFAWSEAVTPALTAVAQPFHAVGAGAVQLLNRRLADPMAPRKVVRLPPEIMHRESCGCGAG